MKEFNALHLYLRILIIGIIIMMPIWFIDIFMFKRLFFNSHEIYISVILSYCLSLTWLIPSLALAFLFRPATFFSNKKDEKEIILNSGVLIAVISLIISSGIAYIFHFDFFGFLITAFVLSLYTFIKTLLFDRPEKKKGKQE